MRVYKTRGFQRWLNKQVLTDEILLEAVFEIDQGLVDANLGGSLYKKSVVAQFEKLVGYSVISKE